MNGYISMSYSTATLLYLVVQLSGVGLTALFTRVSRSHPVWVAIWQSILLSVLASELLWATVIFFGAVRYGVLTSPMSWKVASALVIFLLALSSGLMVWFALVKSLLLSNRCNDYGGSSGRFTSKNPAPDYYKRGTPPGSQHGGASATKGKTPQSNGGEP